MRPRVSTVMGPSRTLTPLSYQPRAFCRTSQARMHEAHTGTLIAPYSSSATCGHARPALVLASTVRLTPLVPPLLYCFTASHALGSSAGSYTFLTRRLCYRCIGTALFLFSPRFLPRCPGMVHTSYHLTVSAPQLPGALDRLGRFFTDPLLLPDSILKEVGGVGHGNAHRWNEVCLPGKLRQRGR